LNDSEIEQLLASRRTEDRIRAVNLLRAHSGPRLQELLLRALKDRSSYVATTAAEILGEYAEWGTAAEMRERFLELSKDGPLHDPGCHIRSHLAFAFGRLEFTPASDALELGLKAEQIEAVAGVPFDTAAHLRANCALALGQMHAHESTRHVALLLFEPGFSGGARQKTLDGNQGAETRKAAARALRLMGDPSGLMALAIKLKYPAQEAPEVLQECMESVVGLAPDDVVDILQPYLDHSDQGLAAYAALMIAKSGVHEGIRLVLDAVKRLSGDPLAATVMGLAALRSDDAVEATSMLSNDLRVEVRLAVVEAMGAVAIEPFRKVLTQMAEYDRWPRVRESARRALQRFR
jgi:HEAT repeat protein